MGLYDIPPSPAPSPARGLDHAAMGNFVSVLQNGYDALGQLTDPTKLGVVERIAIAEFIIEHFESGKEQEAALAYLASFIPSVTPAETQEAP